MPVAGLQIRITFKNQELLRGVNWEVKRGERVGLVGEALFVTRAARPPYMPVLLFDPWQVFCSIGLSLVNQIVP